jgi:ATP-dependent Clp protease protease subunit
MSVDREAQADFKNRIIYLFGPVDGEMAFKAITALHEMERLSDTQSITVFLNTEGGSEPDGWAIYDAFRRSNCQIYVVGLGEVQSMGMILLQMGDSRKLAHNVRCLIHLGFGPDLENTHSLVLKSLGKEQEVCDRMYVQCLAERSRQKYEDVLEWCTHETHMSANEAVEKGFADGIY